MSFLDKVAIVAGGTGALGRAVRHGFQFLRVQERGPGQPQF